MVRRIANFAFTPEHSLEKPEATGVALAAFLREKRFTASRVVAGVPARWLIASEKDIPPANEQQAVAALSLQAERAAGEGNEIVFDFSGEPNPQASSRVLLVGIARQQFDRVNRILDTAGLAILAITSTGLDSRRQYARIRKTAPPCSCSVRRAGKWSFAPMARLAACGMSR